MIAAIPPYVPGQSFALDQFTEDLLTYIFKKCGSKYSTSDLSFVSKRWRHLEKKVFEQEQSSLRKKMLHCLYATKPFGLNNQERLFIQEYQLQSTSRFVLDWLKRTAPTFECALNEVQKFIGQNKTLSSTQLIEDLLELKKFPIVFGYAEFCDHFTQNTWASDRLIGTLMLKAGPKLAWHLILQHSSSEFFRENASTAFIKEGAARLRGELKLWQNSKGQNNPFIQTLILYHSTFRLNTETIDRLLNFVILPLLESGKEADHGIQCLFKLIPENTPFDKEGARRKCTTHYISFISEEWQNFLDQNMILPLLKKVAEIPHPSLRGNVLNQLLFNLWLTDWANMNTIEAWPYIISVTEAFSCDGLDFHRRTATTKLIYHLANTNALEWHLFMQPCGLKQFPYYVARFFNESSMETIRFCPPEKAMGTYTTLVKFFALSNLPITLHRFLKFIQGASLEEVLQNFYALNLNPIVYWRCLNYVERKEHLYPQATANLLTQWHASDLPQLIQEINKPGPRFKGIHQAIVHLLKTSPKVLNSIHMPEEETLPLFLAIMKLLRRYGEKKLRWELVQTLPVLKQHFKKKGLLR